VVFLIIQLVTHIGAAADGNIVVFGHKTGLDNSVKLKFPLSV